MTQVAEMVIHFSKTNRNQHFRPGTSNSSHNNNNNIKSNVCFVFYFCRAFFTVADSRHSLRSPIYDQQSSFLFMT